MNLMEIFEKLFDIKKVPAKFILVIWISMLFIIFTPEDILLKFNLSMFIKEYGKYIGITFISSSAFIVVIFFTYIQKSIIDYSYSRKTRKLILKNLNSLDVHEQALLREFFLFNQSAIKLPIDNETVIGLVSKKILYQVQNMSFVYNSNIVASTYCITDIAKENIENSSSLIGMSYNPTEQELNNLMLHRPSWLR